MSASNKRLLKRNYPLTGGIAVTEPGGRVDDIVADVDCTTTGQTATAEPAAAVTQTTDASLRTNHARQ